MFTGLGSPNNSLLTLGSVISALAENAAKNKRYNYESFMKKKLTTISLTVTMYHIAIPSSRASFSLHYLVMRV